MELILGKTYTRAQIAELVGGGDRQSYLPQVDGRAVAGCFDPDRNLRAPTEIDVGDGPVVIKTARLLVEDKQTIPVFLKRATNAWEFVGYFRATAYSDNPSDLDRPDRRDDAVAVFYLEEVAPEGSADREPVLPSGPAYPENRALVRHYRRERSRQLVLDKRRAFKRIHGRIFCEVCGLEPRSSLGEAGEACLEAHHLTPLSEAAGQVATRLDDLALLCANCHRIIHRLEPLPSIAELRSRIAPAE